MKKFLLFGVAALALALTAGSSFAFDSEKDLCRSERDSFLVFKDYAGQLGVTDEEFAKISAAGKQIVDAENERQANFGVDKNYENVSKLLQIHAGDIVTAADAKSESAIEDIGYSYRFVFLSCRACHKIFKTEVKLSP